MTSKLIFWESNPPKVDPARLAGWTIPAIVRERARREPENVAFAVPDGDGFRRIPWREFGRAVAEAGAGLWSLGLLRGNRAAVMGDPALDWVVSDYGSMTAGAVCVGIYQTSSPPEVAYIFQDAAPLVFFGQRREHLRCALEASRLLGSSPISFYVLLEDDAGDLAAEAGSARIITMKELRRIGAKALADDPSLLDKLVDAGASTDLARIIYTSGTTGRPKGVMYTHHAWLLVGEQWTLRYPPIRAEEHSIVSFLSIAHVAAAMQAEIAPLVSKLVPHFAPPKTDLIEVFRKVRPNVLGMTPRFFQKIAVQLAVAQESGSAFSRLMHRYGMRIGRRIVHKRWAKERVPFHKRVFLKFLQRTIFRQLLSRVGFDRVKRAQTGSAVMPVEVAALWAVWGVDIREAYGLSEAACAVAYQLEEFPCPGTIGKLIPFQIDTELKLAPDGEILFKSPMLFSGYWNAPEATVKALRDGWFYTGDIAEVLPDGNLRLVGRKNDAISTAGGKTINPAEIESQLKLSPYISEAVVFGHGEKYLTALIEIELASVSAWAKGRGHVASSYSGLVDLTEVNELIDGEVKEANRKLGRALQIKKFRLLPTPLDKMDGALTSAKKVKRRVVEEQFHDLLELMYDRSEKRILAARLRG